MSSALRRSSTACTYCTAPKLCKCGTLRILGIQATIELKSDDDIEHALQNVGMKAYRAYHVYILDAGWA